MAAVKSDPGKHLSEKSVSEKIFFVTVSKDQPANGDAIDVNQQQFDSLAARSPD